MNSGATSERVYDALKRRLLNAEFRPGDRLDPAVLSESLNSSVTPVRDALHQLAGENLIETRTGEGFYRPHLTAPDLEDLYAWAEQVAAIAMRNWSGRSDAAHAALENMADRTASLFLRIAARSANVEHMRAIAAVNDRLHAIRVLEGAFLSGCFQELDTIEQAVASVSLQDLRRLVSAYYRRRQRAASDIVRLIYRGS